MRVRYSSSWEIVSGDKQRQVETSKNMQVAFSSFSTWKILLIFFLFVLFVPCSLIPLRRWYFKSCKLSIQKLSINFQSKTFNKLSIQKLSIQKLSIQSFVERNSRCTICGSQTKSRKGPNEPRHHQLLTNISIIDAIKS